MSAVRMVQLLLVTVALVLRIAAFGNIVTVPCNQTAPLAVVNDTLYNVRDCNCGVAIQMTLPPGLALENVAIHAVNSFVTFGPIGITSLRNFEYRWVNYSDRPCRSATTGAMVSDFYAAGAVTLLSGAHGVFSGVTLEVSNCDIDMRPEGLTPTSFFSVSGPLGIDLVQSWTVMFTDVTLNVNDSAYRSGGLGWLHAALLFVRPENVRCISNLNISLLGVTATTQLWGRFVAFGSLNTSFNVSVTIHNATFVTNSWSMFVVLSDVCPLYMDCSFVCTDVVLRCGSKNGQVSLIYVADSDIRNAFISLDRVSVTALLSLRSCPGGGCTVIPFASVVTVTGAVSLTSAIVRANDVELRCVLTQSFERPYVLSHTTNSVFDLVPSSDLTAVITNTHVRSTLGGSGGGVVVDPSVFHAASSIISITEMTGNNFCANITFMCTNVSSLIVAATNITSSTAPVPFSILALYNVIVTLTVRLLSDVTIELVNATARSVVDPNTVNTIGFQQGLDGARRVRWNVTAGSALISFAIALRKDDVLGTVPSAMRSIAATLFASLVGSYKASNVNITISNSLTTVETVGVAMYPQELGHVMPRSSMVVVGTITTANLKAVRSQSEHVLFGMDPSATHIVTIIGDGLCVRDLVSNVDMIQEVVVEISNSVLNAQASTGPPPSTAVVDPVPAFSSPNGTAISNSWFSMANCTAEGYDALFPCSDAASRVSLWCVAMRNASSDPWSLVAAGDAARVGGNFSTNDDAAIGRSGACWLGHTTTTANRALQAAGPLTSAVALTSAVGGGQLGFAAAALQRSLLTASLASKCGAGVGSDEDLSFSDNPTRLEAAGISFGGATDAAVLQSAGATLGNVLLLCGCGCALAAFGAWRCWRAMPVGGTIQAADVAVAARLPSSLLWLQALLLQPSVQHGLASMSAAAGNAATVVVGAVGVACFVCPVVIVFAAVFRHRNEVVAIRRPIDRSLVSHSSCVVRWKARLYWRGWDWRPARRASSTASAGSSACSRSAALLLATCGAYFQEYRRGARYYFMVDAVCGALCGAAAGISVPAEACMVPAYVVIGVSVASLALLLVVRPYATLAGNMFIALNNALTVLCAVLALVPSAQGTVSGIALGQAALALAVTLSSILACWTLDDLAACGMWSFGCESSRGRRRWARLRCDARSRNPLPVLAFPFDRLKSTPGSAENNLSDLVMAICDSRPLLKMWAT